MIELIKFLNFLFLICILISIPPPSAGGTNSNESISTLYVILLVSRSYLQCALAAIKDKQNPYFRVKYDRIKKRRGHKRAIISIARMILTCLYHMFLKKEAFQPSDIHYEGIPDSF